MTERMVKVRFRPLFSVVGMAGGILTALGVLVWLQQSGTVYPTRNVTVLAVVIGLVWGVVVPSLGRWAKVRRAVARRRV